MTNQCWLVEGVSLAAMRIMEFEEDNNENTEMLEDSERREKVYKQSEKRGSGTHTPITH